MLIHGEKVLNREVKWKLNGVKEGQREQDIVIHSLGFLQT